MLNRRHFIAAAAAPLLHVAGTWVPAWAQNAPNFGTPVLPTPGFRRTRVSDAEIIAVIDGVARRPLGEEFVRNAPLAEVKALLSSQGLSTDYVDIPFTPFLVVVGGRRILMDTGLGEFGGPTTGKLLAHLQAAGIQAGDIDDVVITHFHGDHINGLRNRAGAFPFTKARVHVPAPESAFWMDDAKMNAAAAGMKGAFENVRRTFAQMPAAMLQQFVPGSDPVPGIASIAAYGHTPGHTLFQVGSGRSSFTYIGDLTNVPSLFARNPDWAVVFDMDAEAARQTRRDMFARLVQQGGVVGGFHFPFPAFGRMVPSGKGYAFEAIA